MTNIIIVGAGVAGLSAGIYARSKGYDVSIYEKHFKSGGNLTGWDRKGYHIDNCIHWLTGTNPSSGLYKMWEDLGVLNGEDVIQTEVLFTYKEKDKEVSLYNDLDKTKNNMLEIAKEDKKEILSFIKGVEIIQKIMGVYGSNNDEKGNIIDVIFKYPSLLKYYLLSTKELAKRFKNPILKKFLVSVISEHFSSLALLIIFATYTGKNGGIPKGSSCEMAKNMEDKFLSMGGKLYHKSGVKKINIQDDRAVSVILEDGKTIDGDFIVVTGDPKYIFNELLPPVYMPVELHKKYEDSKMMRFSAYHCAYGVDAKDVSFKGDLILEVPLKHMNKLHSRYIILREFSHEPSFSPENKSLIQVMVYCNEDVCKSFIALSEDKEEYNKVKQEISQTIEEIIVNELGELKGKLKLLDVWTPSTYKRYTNSEIGSFMGFVLPPRRMVKSLTNRIEGVDNVILASQWLEMPGGLPIAAKVGKKAIETIEDMLS